jgi:uncharacterized protein (DUF433 family)
MSAEPEPVTEAIDAVGHIVRTPGVMSGRPRIKGTRIRVSDIAAYYLIDGQTVEDILDGFPFITAADVHAALAYYFDHADEMAADRTDDVEFAERFARENPDIVSFLGE